MSLLTNREKEERPWGSFERFTLNEPSTVKLLWVKAGEEFSLQHHEHRSEFWRVVAGSGSVTIGESVHEAKAGDEFEIPPHTLHRAKGGAEGLEILEIALGSFDEGDIVRVEDDYGRTAQAEP